MQNHITKAAGATVLTLISAGLATAHEVDDKNRVEETHNITDFNKIRVTGVYELDVQVGENFSVFTSGKHKDVEGMKVYLKGSTLVLAQDEDRDKKINWNGRKKNNSGIKAIITLPTLKVLDITGIGAGEIKGIESERLDVEVAGISDMELSGNCGNLDVDMAGLGELRAENLQCENVEKSKSFMASVKIK